MSKRGLIFSNDWWRSLRKAPWEEGRFLQHCYDPTADSLTQANEMQSDKSSFATSRSQTLCARCGATGLTGDPSSKMLSWSQTKDTVRLGQVYPGTTFRFSLEMAKELAAVNNYDWFAASAIDFLPTSKDLLFQLHDEQEFRRNGLNRFYTELPTKSCKGMISTS